ncbi:universal stress protein [Amycolatopsis alba]|uniref:Universal stress protein n=1 Tax=Amycolatopsis alba DSM 44262 TaxID=1125972 RepID=A0A229RFF3_AMYAL|nr:universal stress protein [Amycolatopsis alba]OXM45402.1 universal stress protein [Amycolatopsis alba DSM 44262]
MNASPENARRIVVGADGSPGSEEAISWAVTEAAARGDRVEVLLVLPREELLPGTSFALQPHGRVPVRNGYSVKDAAERIRAKLDAEVTVETSVRQGNPTSELLAAAHGADLLVLGSPSRKQWERLVFGSVATACVKHATCPVALVTPEAVHRFSPSAS